MEEVSEIFIMMRGEVKIGFRLNHRQSYALKGDDMLFGAYNMTFNKRSLYVFRISAKCKENNGYFIRRKNWHTLINDKSMMDENKKLAELCDKLKAKLEKEYFKKLVKPMTIAKNKAMQKFRLRNDYDQILGVAHIDRDNKKIWDTAFDLFKPTNA